MKLKQKDVKVGDLLKGICNISLADYNLIHYDCLYIVSDTTGLSDNGIWVICVKTGDRIHANARYFLKTDKN